MKPLSLLCCGLAWLPLCAPAQTQRCKYVDAEGRITFSNAPVKNARLVMCFPPVLAQPKAPRRTASAPPARDAAAFPRVDPATQRNRDSDRRRVLQQELADEQRQLEEARTLLSRSESGEGPRLPDALLKPLRDAVATHESNIAAIRQELGASRQ
jgi:hypothetical protein